MLKKLKTVQIGLGHDHATGAMDTMLARDDFYEVLGFAVPDSERELCAKQIESYKNRGVPYYTVEEALHLPGVEAAVIETEEVSLQENAIRAAEAGLHIYMDKPGAPDVASFERLVHLVKEKNLTFELGYMYRYNPKILEAMEKIKNGDIGEVYCVEAHMDCEHIPQKRQWLGRFPGGMLFFLGCHLVDLIYRIQGKPDAVIPMNCPTNFDGVTADDYGMVLYRYPHGISFAKSCANEIGGYMRRQLVICGTKGTIEIKPLEIIIPNTRNGLQTAMRVAEKGNGWGIDGVRTQCDTFGRYDDMMTSFVEYVRGTKENPYTPDYELELFQLIMRSCGA